MFGGMTSIELIRMVRAGSFTALESELADRLGEAIREIDLLVSATPVSVPLLAGVGDGPNT